MVEYGELVYKWWTGEYRKKSINAITQNQLALDTYEMKGLYKNGYIIY